MITVHEKHESNHGEREVPVRDHPVSEDERAFDALRWLRIMKDVKRAMKNGHLPKETAKFLLEVVRAGLLDGRIPVSWYYPSAFLLRAIHRASEDEASEEFARAWEELEGIREPEDRPVREFFDGLLEELREVFEDEGLLGARCGWSADDEKMRITPIVRPRDIEPKVRAVFYAMALEHLKLRDPKGYAQRMQKQLKLGRGNRDSAKRQWHRLRGRYEAEAKWLIAVLERDWGRSLFQRFHLCRRLGGRDCWKRLLEDLEFDSDD